MDGGVVAYQDKLCYVKMLDCSQTCCMNSYCAPHMGFCINYVRQDFNQLYIGVLVAVTIVVGIPLLVSFCDCILNYKFGQVYNEEADATLGGLTCCEAFSYCCTCGKCMKNPETMKDDWVVQYEILERGRFEKLQEEQAFDPVQNLGGDYKKKNKSMSKKRLP